MPGKDAFTVEGTIVKRLGVTLFRVELANGHELLAYGSKKHSAEAGKLEINEKVLVRLSPYDLSKGRLILERLENES